MNLKQDINMARKATDIETKYKLGDISATEKRVTELEDNTGVDKQLSPSSKRPVANSVITEALSGKVNTVAGKGLSANDFTNLYKDKLDNIEEQTLGSVIFNVNQITSASWNEIGTLSIGGETIHVYKKIS